MKEVKILDVIFQKECLDCFIDNGLFWKTCKF